jgi:hypothetical protein
MSIINSFSEKALSRGKSSSLLLLTVCKACGDFSFASLLLKTRLLEHENMLSAMLKTFADCENHSGFSLAILRSHFSSRRAGGKLS